MKFMLNAAMECQGPYINHHTTVSDNEAHRCMVQWGKNADIKFKQECHSMTLSSAWRQKIRDVKHRI